MSLLLPEAEVWLARMISPLVPMAISMSAAATTFQGQFCGTTEKLGSFSVALAKEERSFVPTVQPLALMASFTSAAS
uniref:hypothetical protein n=1 Tax=Trichocoleus desertorum TaxID=1481672 RepID=UPI0025B57301|nr:hypothetical protein [Trichocoleus desertorum]